MAIQASYTHKGLTAPAAYIRLTRPVFISKTSCRFYAQVFTEASRSTTGEDPLTEFPFDCEYALEGVGNVYNQAYLCLKMLPEYATALDV